MGTFFYNLGRFVGEQARKARWAAASLAGSEADAARAERAVGKDLARAVLEEAPPDPDPAAARWLDEVGGLVAAQAAPGERTFCFRAVLLAEPNAFALPGGFVFVSRPLLRMCQSAHDDLAFVLGHEVAHVVRGHALERLLARSLVGTAGRLGALRLLRGPLGGLMGVLLRQGYAQDQELEADRVGADLARRAGFDPAAAPRLLARLRLLSAQPGELLGYFSSHPPWEVRIDNLRRGM